MSLPGADVGRSMSSKEDASEAAKQVAAAAAEGEEVAADEDDPLISATSSMPMAAPADTAFTNKEGRAAAAAKSAKKKKKKGRGDAKVGKFGRAERNAPIPFIPRICFRRRISESSSAATEIRSETAQEEQDAADSPSFGAAQLRLRRPRYGPLLRRRLPVEHRTELKELARVV